MLIDMKTLLTAGTTVASESSRLTPIVLFIPPVKSLADDNRPAMRRRLSSKIISPYSLYPGLSFSASSDIFLSSSFLGKNTESAAR